MYSIIALSPVLSESDKCNVAKRCSPGTLSVMSVKGSFSKAATASATVA